MNRITGLDVARALAIIGMIAAHLAGTTIVTEGYPAVLFAVLAGVSSGIIADRARLIIRGVLLIIIGVALEPLPHFIPVVLASMGVIVISIGLLYRLRTQTLLWILFALILLGVPAQMWLGENYDIPLVTGVYPVNAWIIYGIVGLLIRRYLLHSAGRQRIVLGESLAVAAIGLLIHAGPLVYVNIADGSFLMGVLSPVPHSGGLLDIAFSAAASIFVICACLLLCRNATVDKLLYPLRAMGSMSLTSYVAHILAVSVAVAGDFIVLPSGENPVFDFVAFAWGSIIALLVFAVIWKHFFTRGPLEALMRVIIEALAPARTNRRVGVGARE
ncbi:DUF418 domain-containing protein [Corynebacterium pacaense]|uniref:DUF418 domain-containing protein n=1 Tax=Corynebacterium pacaense TaxID=1816684 RepID=UPI0009B9C9F4|nr:DUF418 domain-containing protein [Corynebacterium pacaense]